MAVNLDNAQNFEAARQSYADACNLLQQVIQRTAGNEEKCKLEAIVSDGFLTGSPYVSLNS